MAETDNTPCAICNGARSEHGEGKSAHAYTLVPGDLVTPSEMAKRNASQRGTTQTVPRGIPVDSLSMGRLVEVLIDTGVIDAPHALYIAGYAPKPPRSAISFQDPARFFPQLKEETPDGNGP